MRAVLVLFPWLVACVLIASTFDRHFAAGLRRGGLRSVEAPEEPQPGRDSAPPKPVVYQPWEQVPS